MLCLCTRRIPPTSSFFLPHTQSCTLGPPPPLPPSSAPVLSFSQHFLTQNHSFFSSWLGLQTQQALPSGTFDVHAREDPSCTVCPLPVPHPPGRGARRNGGARWRGGWLTWRQAAPPTKGRRTWVVSLAFTLAERNGYKTEAGVQPRESWKINEASPSQERTHGSCVWQSVTLPEKSLWVVRLMI